ncbi:unnamed protein product [Adineta ricciae]|uniref:G-protein coupled receptors family 1 profile domain-containing protein n=1 Tax=Adineta ricciae TaxID=249248 RepID=A0A814VNB5_ADIRI|nr:unnamed protein product [Adineta ricciae]
MSADSDQHRPSFRFRDKFSRFKNRVKDKIRDKGIKHNVTLFVHHNLTTNDTHDSYSSSSHHGFRDRYHHYKDALKNKTHYESIKHKIKDKIDDTFDLHDNKTYPKGFYDSLFSPETENDVYLQTALICLWVIALLCIIPTIIVIFLPARKKTRTTTSTNMIFFHVFLCELCYLTYILLAMINVGKDFRLGSLFCDIANYGMYVTIPIMQFALLFLSIERLSKHFDLSMTCLKIFTKPYLIQLILCIIWIVLIALLVTFMFIKKQFSFNFIKDKAYSLAPPIVGDVVHKLASRRHHCSIDGRLSSILKAVLIILFILLIVKPILFSLGFNLLSPFCCRGKRKESEKQGDRRTTTLVTIFLLLNLFFSFPFYFVSMFNNILTRIDSTKDTFSLVLKICFILRIANIIFECLAFYIFERNSWNLLSKLFYYITCKKFESFKSLSDDDTMYTKDPAVIAFINNTRRESNEDDDDNDDDDDDDDGVKIKKKQITTKKSKKPVKSRPKADEEDEDEDEDDGAFTKRKKKPSVTKSEETEDESDDTKLVKKRAKKSRKQVSYDDDDDDDSTKRTTTTIKRKSRTKETTVDDNEEDDGESDQEEEEEQTTTTVSRRKARPKSKEEDDEDELAIIKRKSDLKIEEEDDDDDDGVPMNTRRKSRQKNKEEDDNAAPSKIKRNSRIKINNDDEEEEEEEEKTPPTTKRRSRAKFENDIEEETVKKPKSQVHTTVTRQEKTIRKPKTKSHHDDGDIRRPNERSTSATTHRHTDTKRHSVKRASTPAESDAEKGSIVSHTSATNIKPVKTKAHSSSTEQKRTRTASTNPKRSHHRTESSPTSRPKTENHHHHHHHTSTVKKKKHSKEDSRTRILKMSDEV